MTTQEKQLWLKLEKNLTYGRGISFNDWEKLIILRTKHLKFNGCNPKEWNIDSKNFSKKMEYRK